MKIFFLHYTKIPKLKVFRFFNARVLCIGVTSVFCVDVGIWEDREVTVCVKCQVLTRE